MELAKVKKDFLLEEGTETSDGFAKPRVFQPSESFQYTDTRSGGTEASSSAFYSHEEGNKYLNIQEQEYKLKHTFRFYYWIIWTYLVAAIINLIVTIAGIISIPDFVKLNNLVLLLLNAAISVIVIVGVISAISARRSGEYEKNRLFIKSLFVTLFIIGFEILYEIFLISDSINFKSRIMIQLVLIATDIFLINQAKKMLDAYNQIKKMQDELVVQSYFSSPEKSNTPKNYSSPSPYQEIAVL